MTGLGLIFVALASFCKQVFTFAGYGEEALQKQNGILDFRISLIFHVNPLIMRIMAQTFYLTGICKIYFSLAYIFSEKKVCIPYGLVGGKKFSPVMTDLPVLRSNSLRAFLAILPPFLLAVAFFVNPFACSLSAICRVESSAKAVKINSASDMWSRRFCVFSFFNALCFVLGLLFLEYVRSQLLQAIA